MTTAMRETAARPLTFVFAATLSFVVGTVAVHLAPAAWRLEPWQGLLLGAALYMGVLHRWIARREREPGTTLALVWRAALVLTFVAAHAYAYFEWLPAADLRAPFVMLSGWVVAESLLSPRPEGARTSGSWPRA